MDKSRRIAIAVALSGATAACVFMTLTTNASIGAGVSVAGVSAMIGAVACFILKD